MIALPGSSAREIKRALELLVDLNREVWKTTSHTFERHPEGREVGGGNSLSKARGQRGASSGRLERITQVKGGEGKCRLGNGHVVGVCGVVPN